MEADGRGCAGEKEGVIMLMRYCPRCRKLIPQSKHYCDDCQKLVDQKIAEAKERSRKERARKYAKEYNKKRDPEHVRFYHSRAWKQLRAAKLAEAEYLCEECRKKGILTMAEDVHHIVPISEDWEKRLDMDNLRCLCVNCHNLAHNRGWSKKFET